MIIGVSGKIGSGKDTVGKIIQYLTVSDYENVKAILKERNDREITVEEHFNSFLERDYKVQWQIKKFAGKLKQIVSILTGIPVGDLEKQEVKDRVLGEEWWYWGIINQTHCIYRMTNEKEARYKANALAMKVELIKPTVRQLLQEIGTDAMRNVIHENVWVNALFADYKEKFSGNIVRKDSIEDDSNWNYPNWIIADVRFPNELQAVKDRGGITIRVNRPIIHSKGIYSNEGVSNEVIKKVSERHREEISKMHPSEKALDNATFDYVIDNNEGIPELIHNVKNILTQENII